MQLSPMDAAKQAASNAAKYNPKALEQANEFNEALTSANKLAEIQAAEHMSKDELRKQKDAIEDGAGMAYEEETEETLKKDLDHLKRKLSNVVDHQQRKSLGL